MSDFQFFMPIAKVDKDSRTVSGYASTPTKDGDGEIVTLDAIKGALPGYMEYANIREMHKLNAVGVADEANVDKKGLFLTARIVDDSAWNKCLEGVYKGFSIGGRKLAKTGNKITAIEMTEISIVDRPSNPDARFALAKSQKSMNVDEAGGYLLKSKSPITVEARALAKMAKIVGSLAKANPPAANDGFSLPAKKVEGAPQPDDTMSPNDSRPNENVTRKAEDTAVACKLHGIENCEKCKAATKKAEGGGDKEPYGDVDYADPGLQEDKKKRYPIDTEEHIRAAWNYINKSKNAAKYGSNAGKVKAKIVAAWKAKIDKDGPPAAQKVSKSAKAIARAKLDAAFGLSTADSFLVLKKSVPIVTVEESPSLLKSMNTAGSLAYCFDSIRGAQRSLLMEAKREGGDMKDKALAKQLGSVAKTLAEIISQKATHEGSEALDMSDADDQYLTSMLGEDFDMNKVTANSSGDPLTDAVAMLMKRAAEPSKAQRMASASDDVKKARKAMKSARSAIEEAHKMHKAAYLAKAAKKSGSKKPDDNDDDDEFDHAGAMEKLQKAYGEIDKARTFGKAAGVQIAKAASGLGPADGNEFHTVPPGVKNMDQSELTGAGPGGGERGSQPPMYPVDGNTYAGKAAGGEGNDMDLRKFAKNGQISAEVAELIMAKAKSDGELEALRRMPSAGSNGRRPYAFDMNKVMGGTGNGTDVATINKSLFEGVDPNALNSGDELQHTAASAKVIGNFLTSGHFGKSVFDPSFRGAAGTGRS